MSVAPPEADWWKKTMPREERLWVTIAVVWAIIMFIMMPLWGVMGKQNPSSETYTTTPEQFQKKADEMIKKYKVGEEKGVPVVKPPANSDVYLVARMWSWSPVLELEKGKTYRLHLSSLDVDHGFSLYPMNINTMVVPGYDYVLTITPTQAGEYRVLCNEFCGIGHHMMVGKIVVR